VIDLARAGVVAGAVVAFAAGLVVAPAASSAPVSAAAARTTATTASSTIRTAPSGTVYEGGLHVELAGPAAAAATTLAAQGRDDDAAAARTIAAQPIAIWLGSWYDDAMLVKVVDRTVAAAEKKGATPVFVTYDIPGRDCGGYSAGGAADDAAYLSWNDRVASALAGHRAVVLVEPDSLGHLDACPAMTATRTATLAQAVAAFSRAGVPAYLDGGNSNWVKPADMAARLRAAGIDQARGFFTNVAGYYPVDQERAYAEQVSAATGGARYVIDVSRNGRGWKGTWCNAPGAGLGQTPRVATSGATGLDALLWVKTPGASDGTCNGGPAAGTWFPAYATALVANRR
jgi:endoglucanase